MLTKTLSEAKKKQRASLIKAMNNDIGSIDSAKDSWNPAQISERAKDISYIRSLVDSWNPAQLNEALKMLDLPVIDTWNPAQIEEQRRNLVFYLAERTLTGNPITLNILGNLTPEVTSLKVTMNPIQDTSQGNPSPTNICPISGRTEVNVYQDTEQTETPETTYTSTFGQTVYGGNDYISGVLEIPWSDKVLLSSLTWEKYSGSGYGTLYFTDSLVSTLHDTTDQNKVYTVCEIFDSVTNEGHRGQIGSENEQPDNSIRINTTKRLYARCENAQTLETFQTLISTHSLIYIKDTPTTIETTPGEITLLKGTNVLSTDGDSIELKYKQNF